MFVKNKLVTHTVFSEPSNYINSATVLKRPSVEYQAMYLNSQNTSIPVNIEVNAKTSLLSATSSAANQNISTASYINTMTQNYLSDAISMLEELETIAGSATKDALIDVDRASFNAMAEELIEKFDKLYSDVKFDGEYLLRGGTAQLAVGTDGQTTQINYANLGRAHLGIATIDLTSESSAETAEANIESALKTLQAQYNMAQQDSGNLKSYSNVNTESMDAEKNKNALEYSQEKTITAFENTRAAINSRMLFSVNIQGYDIRTNTIETMFDELGKISKTLRDFQAKTLEKQATGAGKAEDERNIELQKENDLYKEDLNSMKSFESEMTPLFANTTPVQDITPPLAIIKKEKNEFKKISQPTSIIKIKPLMNNSVSAAAMPQATQKTPPMTKVKRASNASVSKLTE